MHGHPTPLVLVVCEDAARVYQLRTELRRNGFLPAFARSADMASALFAQIRIEAVVICPGEALGRLDPLQETVQAMAGIPLFVLADAAPLPGWTACTEEQLIGQLRAIFGERPNP